MSEQVTGKATPEVFERIILRRLGAPDPDVLTPPAHGVDVGVVRVADGVAMALTTDPAFAASIPPIPTTGSSVAPAIARKPSRPAPVVSGFEAVGQTVTPR